MHIRIVLSNFLAHIIPISINIFIDNLKLRSCHHGPRLKESLGVIVSVTETLHAVG